MLASPTMFDPSVLMGELDLGQNSSYRFFTQAGDVTLVTPYVRGKISPQHGPTKPSGLGD